MTLRFPLIRLLCLCAVLLAPSSRADDATPELTERRARAIVNTRCFSCHGPTGLSTTAQFPKLAGQNAAYLVRQMFNFQSGARTSVVMEEQTTGLIGTDIEALAQFFSVQTLRPDLPADARSTALGKRVYFEGNPKTGVPACATCHGPQARGARMLPRLAGQHAPYLERQLQAFAARARSSDQANMHMVAARLTPAEVKAVASFLSSFD